MTKGSARRRTSVKKEVKAEAVFHLTRRASLELRSASKAVARGESLDMDRVLAEVRSLLVEAGGAYVDRATEAELAAAMKETDREAGIPVEEVFARLKPKPHKRTLKMS